MNMPLRKPVAETGSAVMEVAVSYPFLVLMLMAIGLFAWIFWVQAATHIATLEAARSAAFYTGTSGGYGDGYGPFYAALTGLTSAPAADAVGGPKIITDWNRRTVQVSIDGRVTFFHDLLGDSYRFSGGAFTRIQDFFGGPPDPWE